MVGLDDVRPPEQRAVRGSLAFSSSRHASCNGNPFKGRRVRMSDERMVRCTSGRNASLGELTTYQAFVNGCHLCVNGWHPFVNG